MSNFNIVPNNGTFGQAVGVINSNFEIAYQGILQAIGYATNMCGFFQSVAALQAAYPTPREGMIAVVDVSGTPEVYRAVTSGSSVVWTDTGEQYYTTAQFDVVNNLNSSSITSALSANMGRVLGEKISAGCVFAGTATPESIISTPSSNVKVCYLVPEGTYTNFGTSYTVPDGCFGIFTWDGSAWSKANIRLDDAETKPMIGYYECATGASTKAKTVAATGFVLNNGGAIKIKFQYGNTNSAPTLNINSTGAKDIYLNGAAASATNTWVAGQVLEVYYDGTQYQARIITLDDVPTEGSQAPVTSGGVREEINQLGLDLLGIADEIKDFTLKNYAINAQGKFGTSTSYKHAVLPVAVGEVYYLIGLADEIKVAFATSDASSSGADVPFVAGTSVMLMQNAGQYYKYTIPEGCTYLLFNAGGSYGTRCFRHYDKIEEIEDEEPIADSDNLVTSGGIHKKIYEVAKELIGANTEIKDYPLLTYTLGADGNFGTSSSYKHAALPVSEGDVYFLYPNNSSCRAAFATSDAYAKSGAIPFVSGTEIISLPNVNQYYRLEIPEGCTYLLFNATSYTTRCFKHYDTLKEGVDEFTDSSLDDGSDNPIQNKAVSAIIGKLQNNAVDNNNIQFALLDAIGNVIGYTDPEKLKLLLGLDVNAINGVPQARMVQNEHFKLAYLDEVDNIIIGVDKDDNIVSGVWDFSSIKKLTDITPVKDTLSDVYERNIEKDGILMNDAYFTATGGKRFQALVVTDTHLNNISFRNWRLAGRDFSTIDCCIHLGDMTNYVDPGEDNDDFLNSEIKKLDKPAYIAVGNHEVGTSQNTVNYCRENDDMYNQFVLPLINKGYIKSGEYEAGKCYYYHDFASRKIRLVMMYPFERPVDFDETYWKAIEYDANYQYIDAGSYQTGDKVNANGYTKYSFEAVQDVEVPALNPHGYSSNNLYWPRYKALRFPMWFSQEQLEWLCDTLDEAGSLGYTCIIACHYNLLGIYGNDDYGVEDCRFSDPYRVLTGGSFDGYQQSTNPSVVSDIVNAYQKGTSVSVKTECTSRNVYDDVSDVEPVSFNYTFSNSGDVLFIAGHTHNDGMLYSEKEDYSQKCVVFLAGIVQNTTNRDTIRAKDDSKYMDVITGLTIDQDNKQVHLTRIGADITRRIGEDSKLIKKDNEILNY